MKRRNVTSRVIITLIITCTCVISCGDKPSSDEGGAVGVVAVDDSESDEFYPFDEAPVLIYFEAPDYPERAREIGLEGYVAVKVLVGADGAVKNVTTLDASDPVFAAAALKAASQCQFTPAKMEGHPTKSQVMIPYLFRL